MRWQRGIQVSRGSAEHGVMPIGGDVAEGSQYESAVLEAGVWEREVWGLKDVGADREEVQVEGAGCVGDAADPAGLGFDGLEGCEEAMRVEGGRDAGGSVDVVGLVGGGDRAGPIPVRLGDQGQVWVGGERLDGPLAEVAGGASIWAG